MARVRAVRKVSFEEQATELLRAQIVEGGFAPGDRLTEMALADQLEVSRGTVRAALSQLAAEGLVEQIPYTGWQVARIGAEDAWELHSLRSALEGLGARLAAQRIDAAGRRRLDAAFRALEDAAATGRRAAIVDADFGLHRAIIELSGHRRLAEHYRLLEGQVRMLIGALSADWPNMADTAADHAPMVAAIREGDAALAERLAREHNAEAIAGLAGARS